MDPFEFNFINILIIKNSGNNIIINKRENAISINLLNII